MSYFLSTLIPTDHLIASYPCVDIRPDSARLSTILDYSGAGKDLTAVGTGTDKPTAEHGTIREWPTVVHAGESPLLYGPTPTTDVKAIWILAKYDLDDDFGSAYRGLVSGETVGDGLVGNIGDSAFTDFSLGADYYKSRTHYAESAMAAPFDDFEVCAFTSPGPLGLDGIQVGQHKDYDGINHSGADARRWYGRWADLHLFSEELADAEARRMWLYYDLKYRQWLRTGTTLEFPDRSMCGDDPAVGIRPWMHFKAFTARDWASVTDNFEYEDKGMDFNRRTDSPPRRWEIGYNGMSYGQMEIFDVFADTVGIDRTFSLIDKWGKKWEDVRVEDYSSSHRDHKSHDNTASFKLVQYS